MNKINRWISDFNEYLSEQIDGRVLGLFRVLFGMVMVLEMMYYIKIDLVKNMFVLPYLQFKYDGFTWMHPLSEGLMDGLIVLLLLCAILMMLGVWFRWAARFFAVGYAYVFLLDKSIYNNHIYLYILLALMLSFTDADQFVRFGKKGKKNGIPRWQQWVFQFQIVVVYFFAGVIKLKYDWFVLQEPVRAMVAGVDQGHFLAPLLKTELGIYFLVYCGVILDLASPLLLWKKSIRRWAIYLFVLFHLTNTQIFDDIAFFPVAMLASLLIFYEWPSFPTWFKRWIQVPGDTRDAFSTKVMLPNFWRYYLIVQAILPLRGYFLPNDLDWTTIGNRFSWRVKMDLRVTHELAYYVHLENGQVSQVDINSFVNTHQMRLLTYDPRAVRELAIAVKKAVREQGGSVKAVKARIKISRNGRAAQFFVDPETDLTKVKYTPFQRLEWVSPPLS